jgi:anti-sigma factor RsiW
MQHLDEGTIHAWLDGQLPPQEAQAVEAHVAECRQCADAVAEARGLIAASSRILTALDSIPREVVPKEPRFRTAEEAARAADAVADAAADAIVPLELVARRPRRRWFNGASLAAAAAVVVGIGTVALLQQSRRELGSVAKERAEPARVASGPSAEASSAAATPSPAAVPEAKSLGATRIGAATPSIATTQSAATVTRDAANEARLQGLRDEAAGLKKAEPDRAMAARVTTAADSVAPMVIREKEVAANKPAEELTKDTKQLAQSAQPPQAPPASARREALASLQATAKPDSARLDRPQASADAAGVGVGGLRGRVTDANANALAGATVSVDGTTSSVITNSAGEFVISGLRSGAHRLTVRRIGYELTSRDVTVTPSQTVETDVVLNASQVALNQVVVTGAPGAAPRGAASARAKTAAPVPAGDAPPGASITAEQSGAVGCYDLGITAVSVSRNTGFRQVPRRVALESEIVPANAEGVWYRARDLARTNPLASGLWRPTGPDAIELEFTFGSRTARIRVSGPAGAMMRGSLEEIDRATATGDAGNVVAVRRSCEP